MKLSIPQEKLKKGLAVVERIASKSLTLPILNNVLLSVEKNLLNIAATDLEIGIRWWGLAKAEKQGKITVPSNILSSFVGLLPNQKINLDEKENVLSVSCGDRKTQIKGLPADDFPIIPRIGEGETVSLDAPAFCASLSQVADIVSYSTSRPEISGVFLSFQKDLLTMAATDSFRLAEKKVSLKKNKTPLKREYSLIVPQKTAKEIINIFGEEEKTIKVYFSPNQVMFESLMEETDHPRIQVISRLMEGEYPSYQEIIPESYKTQAVLNKTEFLNQIKAASLFSGKTNEINVKTDSKKEKIRIVSQSSEIGEYNSEIKAEIKGKAVDVAFNHKFLLDGLAKIKSSEIIFEFNEDSGPGVIKPVGDNTYIYVVMPIKAS